MLAGGEEYFAPPKDFDAETLTRFASLCNRLRTFEKATKKSIESLVLECEAVGTTMEAKEIVAGVILRCIRAHTGERQIAYWYLLDKIAKDFPTTFGFLFGKHVEDVATDVMPWEDPALSAKLQSLVEHWDRVFDAEVVARIYQSQNERKYLATHPAEAAKLRAEEEKKWEEVVKEYVEADNLDTYEQPCLAYLQGRCAWGSSCTLLHPEGLEGTLPPETRLGDWRCGCGAINRHFRRRCFQCVREKPQYRKGGQHKSKEEQALSQPDQEALAVLRQQFGYNYCDEGEAVAWWKRKFAAEPVESYIEARRVAYRTSIVPAMSRARVEGSKASHSFVSSLDEQRRKQHRPEKEAVTVSVRMPQVPDVSNPEKVLYLCRVIIERGALDTDFTGHLFLLAQALPHAVKDHTFSASRAVENSVLILECCKLVFKAWAAWKATKSASNAMHPATPFFGDVRKYLSLLPLTESHRGDVANMCAQVAQG